MISKELIMCSKCNLKVQTTRIAMAIRERTLPVLVIGSSEVIHCHLQSVLKGANAWQVNHRLRQGVIALHHAENDVTKCVSRGCSNAVQKLSVVTGVDAAAIPS